MSLTTNPMQAPIAPRVLHEAAVWLATLHSGQADEADRQGLRQWRGLSEEHERAWGRAEQLAAALGGIPSGLGLPTLQRAQTNSRRAALRTLALLLSAGPAGWLAYRAAPRPDWTADERTAVGQRRERMLPDGSRLTLNTDSAVDLRFDATQRLVRLRHGEIHIETAADAAHRPFLVQTEHGRLRALGTRFTVRQFEQRSRVAVRDGAVEISPARRSETLIVEAGWQANFDERSAEVPSVLRIASEAWLSGVLVANDERLADFVAELSRYRRGILRCDPEVADLRISGAYQVADPERVLALVEKTFPVRVERSHWWTVLRAR